MRDEERLKRRRSDGGRRREAGEGEGGGRGAKGGREWGRKGGGRSKI